MLTITAYAKVNLTLEVLGKRPDSYHEIRTVLQTIDLHDTLTCKLASKVELESPSVTSRAEDNLVFRAAQTLRQATGCDKGAVLSLGKGIPAAAGLGGGSSDAAAALCALNQLWGTGLSRDALANIAARLGSDVPFFLYGSTALAEGRGEVLTPLPAVQPAWLVLVKPPLDIPSKTGKLYSTLKPGNYTRGEATSALVQRLRQRQPLDSNLLYNAFEAVAFDIFPGLESYKEHLLSAGATAVHLAGSGPSLFALAKDKRQAQAIAGRLKASGIESYAVRTVGVETATPKVCDSERQ